MTCFQKQPIGLETENSLTTINRKIFEIKKKIQLSEGQRKAHFEENDTETRNNAERINKLKKDVKILSEQLAKAKNELGGEKQFRLIKYLHDLGSVGNKNHDQLKEILDLKVIDMHKQLDIGRYKRKKKKAELDKLEQDYQRLVAEKTKAAGDKKKAEKPSKKAISHLENEIHRIAVQWMEAEHVRKKYTGIRYSLLNDSVKFESALANVEQMIKQQNEEINKLQVINSSALEMRDYAMGSLLQQESRAAGAAGIREERLAKAKLRLSDRRKELDKLERRMFPQARPTIVQQDSVGSVDLTPVEEENMSIIGGGNMEDAFQKLMKITGVSDPEDVFDRFKAQKATTERLFYLKNINEEEKKNLETDQNIMIGELEAYKFAQMKDKEDNIEEMEKLKANIEEEIEKQNKYKADEKTVLDVLLDIKRCFYDCCMKLEDADDVAVPDWSDDTSNMEDIFELLKKKFSAARMIAEPAREENLEYLTAKRLEEKTNSQDNPPMEKNPSEERNILPAAYQDLMAPRTKSRGTGTPSGPQKALVSDEEEEIPSRGFLKRQAQLIVDTKSRRKGYRIPPLPKK